MSSWSGTRKRLEREFLCEKLRGRVQYFLTRYHGAPDQYGRFAVRLDGKEIVFANPYNEGRVSCEAARIKAELGESRPWYELYENDRPRYDEIFRRADAYCIEQNAMDVYHVTDAIREYLNAPVERSLASENAAVRMFAVLDRRVGKRTLAKISASLSRQPDWLRPFYEVRLRVEGLL